MSTTCSVVTIQHVGGHEEEITCGWVYGPKDGVLHLHEVDDGQGNLVSRAIVLANVVSYTSRRIR